VAKNRREKAEVTGTQPVLLLRVLPSLIFAAALALLVVVFYDPGHTALPGAEKRYERVKQSAAALRLNSKRAALREHWEKLAAEFRDIYEKSPDWPNRPAAFFRAAECLEDLARHSLAVQDARRAADMYEELAVKHPQSRLADDALFRAAHLRAAWLRDEKGALDLISVIKRCHPNGDMLPGAIALQKTLEAAARGRTAPPEAGKAVAAERREMADERPAHARERNDAGREQKATGGDRREAGTARSIAPPPGSASRTVSSMRAGDGQSPRMRLKPARPRMSKSDMKTRRLGGMADQLGLTVGRIFIDAGHGGRDPGAGGHNVLERHVTLDVAQTLGRLLEARGLEVVYSRTADKTISLGERTRKANDTRADLFVSVHVNANEDPSVNGFETYYLDFAANADAARVAALENAVGEQRLGDMQRLMADVMLNARVEESRKLAGDIQRLSVFRLKRRDFTVKSNGVKAAPFHVLIGAHMPAVLVELGYCTNSAEAANLANRNYRHALAEGLAEGILAYRDGLGKADAMQAGLEK
jgi:N-acetylmuramoyl-L-alanine amidase